MQIPPPPQIPPFFKRRPQAVKRQFGMQPIAGIITIFL